MPSKTRKPWGSISTQDQHLWKAGGLLAIVGFIIFMIANLAHPHSPHIEEYEEPKRERLLIQVLPDLVGRRPTRRRRPRW